MKQPGLRPCNRGWSRRTPRACVLGGFRRAVRGAPALAIASAVARSAQASPAPFAALRLRSGGGRGPAAPRPLIGGSGHSVVCALRLGRGAVPAPLRRLRRRLRRFFAQARRARRAALRARSAPRSRPPAALPPRSGCSSLRPPGCCASLRGRPSAPLLRPFARPRPCFGVAALRAARFGGRARSAPPPSASPVARAGGRRVPPARAPPSAGLFLRPRPPAAIFEGLPRFARIPAACAAGCANTRSAQSRAKRAMYPKEERRYTPLKRRR